MTDHLYYIIFDWNKEEVWGYLRAFHGGSVDELNAFVTKSIGGHASLESMTPAHTAEVETNILLARMPVLEFHQGDAVTGTPGRFAGRSPVIIKKRRPLYRRAFG